MARSTSRAEARVGEREERGEAEEAWIPAPDPGRRPALRLLCLPYAGGSGASYRRWAARLPSAVEVAPLQLPGRPPRGDAAPFREIPALARAAASALEPHLDVPVALFGHSFGAICAFELARELRRRGRPLPVHLFASAIPAPHVLGPALETLGTDTSGWEDSRFLARAGPTIRDRDALGASPELAALALPALRADSEALASYRYVAEEPLACPISAFAGADDELMPEPALRSWRDQTRGRFELRRVRGGHWFVDSDPDGLLRLLGGTLQRTLRRLRAPQDEPAPC